MKMLLRTQPPSLPHTLAQGWLFDEYAAARCKRAQVAYGAEITSHAVLHELGCAIGVCCHDRQGTGHSF